MAANFPRGRFVWHELMTTDPDAAVRFYTKVVGWASAPYPQSPDYRLWMMGGARMAGLMRLPEESRRMGTPPSWLTYVAVPDVDTTVQQAQRLGGRVLVPARTMPDVGRFATLADARGAAFSVFRPNDSAQGSDDAPLGGFSWHELATIGWSSVWEFYRALFGWEKSTAMDMGAQGTYQMFTRPGFKGQLGGIYEKPATMPAAPHWLAYTFVANVDRAADTVRQLGGKIINGPMDVPGSGRIVMCIDPQGAEFALHALVAATPAKPAAKPAGAQSAAKRAAKPKKKVAKKAKSAKPKKKAAKKAKKVKKAKPRKKAKGRR